MGTRSRELIVLLAICALCLSEPINKTSKQDDDSFYQYDDYEEQEVLFSEDKPCPRDCICTVSQGYRIAKCNRLEVGTQKFGDEITDLVIENADPKFPIELDDYIFKRLGLHQVATIKIVNSTIASVSPKAFHGLHDLYAVNLSNNKLKSLHPETFANNKKLLLLTLSHNELKFPPQGSDDYFLNATSVQELDISNCAMRYITPNTFKYMPGLMYLNLALNYIDELDPDTFKKLLDLEELDLSDNNIRSLPNDIFSENTELATLHIQRTLIETVYGLQISDLLTLNAGQTLIKFIGPSMFNGMTYIANLNLNNNIIEKIHNQAFHKLVELNYLDLSSNNLDFVSNILIKENIELDIFKIANNPKLTQLPENGFECSAEQFNIYLFDASNCALENITDNALSTFTALSQLNLSGNKIKEISPKVFSKCQKLVDINLSYNMISKLDSKIFEQNKELSKLNLRGNPLKTISYEIFIHTPVLAWLDMSHTEIRSLWNEDKNRPATLLKNLSFLNVSHCRITELKQNEIDSSLKLHTLDITNNPLACSRDFENLITWLNKNKVSPSTNALSIANLSKDTITMEHTTSWEALTNKICGISIPHLVEPLQSSVSDEEIWERIDEDAIGNFDLKNTLDDGKIADDTKLTNDDYADDDEIDEDSDDDDAADDDAAEEIDEGDDLDLKVKLIEKPKKTVTKDTLENATKQKVNIDVKLLEKDYIDELNQDVYEPVPIVTDSYDGDHGYYDYLWPCLIVVLGAMILLLIIGKVIMVICSQRDKKVKYNSAIIAAMSQQCRTKKDCGLVYQQLSEELGPTTPKFNRYAPLHSVTVKSSSVCESSPYNSDVKPEAV